MNQRVDRCETCRFWESHESDGIGMLGFCYRFPPPWLDGESCFPLTDAKWHWCGEWQPAQATGNVITISYLG